jgi:hypothetical protein
VIRDVLIGYLIEGKAVGTIADDLNIDRSTVRGHLKDWGITLRPSTNGYALGRDPVCDAIKRSGYPSFHDYAQVKALAPITEQSAELAVSERSLTKVFDAYRKLLSWLKASGVVLPTSQ